MAKTQREQIIDLWKQDTAIFAACLRVQPKGETDYIDFKPFPTQERVWDLIFDHLRVQFLKPRQVGVSYAVLIEVLRRTLCTPHHRTVLLAQHGSTAVEMGQHIVDLYESIPEIYTIAPPAKGQKLTPRTLSFANGSRISIGTANSPFWRGGKAHFALLTEAAYYDDLRGVLARIMPMLGPSSPCLIESTANGDGQYKDLWDDAHSAFHHSFISWLHHPEYVDKRPLPDPLLPEESEYIRLHKLPLPRASWYVHTKRLQPGGSQALFDQEFPVCVTGDTRIGTEFGLLPIRQATDACMGTFGSIIGWWPKKEAPVLKLTTKDGYVIRGTSDHPILDPTTGGFVPMIDAKMVTLCAPRLAAQVHTFQWHPIPMVTSTITVDEDFALWLGMFMGDGSIYGYNIDFAYHKDDTDVAQKWVSLSGTLFDIPCHEAVRSTNGDVKRSSSRLVAELLDLLGCTKLSSKSLGRMRKVCVPEVIWRSPKHVVKQFLRGVFETDGFQHRNVARVVLFSKEPEFISDIQLLLLCFGIQSKIRLEEKHHPDGHIYTGRSLTLAGEQAVKFNSDIGFVSQRKIDRAGFVKTVKRNRMQNAMVDTVVSIVDDGVEPVFDITVKGTHQFDANGIVVHNCEQVAFISSGDRFLPHLLPCPKMPTIHQPARIFSPFYGHEAERAHAYCAGIDVASGSSNGDYSTVVILDVTARTVAATYQAKEAPHNFVLSALDLLRTYGNPRTCVETNTYGLEVQHELRKAHVPMFVRLDAKGLFTDREEQHGFHTTGDTRPFLFASLYAAAVGTEPWILSDPRLIQELNQLIYLRHDYPAAPTGKHDDLAIAFALALQAVSQATIQRQPTKPKLPPMPKTPPRSYEELDKRIRMYGQKAVGK